MKKIKLKGGDVGRYVRVLYSDVGAQDGVITKVNGPDDFRYIGLSTVGHVGNDESNNGAPVIALGNYISAENSGLNK